MEITTESSQVGRRSPSLSLPDCRQTASIDLRHSTLPNFFKRFGSIVTVAVAFAGGGASSFMMGGCSDRSDHGPAAQAPHNDPQANLNIRIRERAPSLIEHGVQQRPNPIPIASAHVICRDPSSGLEVRVVHIFRRDQTFFAEQDKASALHSNYNHAPFGGWVEVQHPDSSLPSIVHDVERGVNGDFTVHMVFMSTLPTIRELGRAVVYEQDREYALQGNVSADRISVEPMTLTGAIWVAHDPTTNTDLAWADCGTLDSSPRMDCYFHVPPHYYQRFMQLIIGDQILLKPYFQCNGVHSSAQNIELTGDRNISQVVKAVLTQDQIDGNAPIFQDQAHKVALSVNERFTRTVRASDENLLARLDSSPFMAKVFDTAHDSTMEKLLSTFNEAADRFNDYIRPHLEQWRDEMARQGVEIEIDEHQVGRSTSGGRGGTMMGFSAKKTWNTMEQDVKRLEDITGVKFVKESNGTRFLPQSARLFRCKSGIEKLEIETRDTIFYRTGYEYGYIADSPVRASWTTQYILNSLPIESYEPARSSRVSVLDHSYAILKHATPLMKVESGKPSQNFAVNCAAQDQILFRIADNDLSESEKQKISFGLSFDLASSPAHVVKTNLRHGDTWFADSYATYGSNFFVTQKSGRAVNVELLIVRSVGGK